MRILFIADIVPYPPNTGIKIRTFNILRELVQRGNQVFLVCFNHQILIKDTHALDEARAALLRYCEEAHIFEIPGEGSSIGRNWKRFRNLFERSPYRVLRYFSREAAAVVKTIIHNHGIDLIHLDKTEFYVYAEPYPQIPAVPTNHNVESLLFLRRANRETSWARRVFSLLQSKKTKRYEKYALSRVPAFVTCTQPDLDTFHALYGIKTSGTVIDNGVDISHYSLRDEKPENFILIVGAQSRDATANFDATIYFVEKIWPAVRNALPDIRLKIVGRDPDTQIKDLAKTDQRVDVLGFVDDERDYFAKSKALVVPLRVGGGSRLKILTAFAMGTPVVSTQIGAEGIECEDKKEILIADKPEDFAAALIQVCREPDMAETIARNARQLAERRYDWRVIGENLDKLYSGLVGG